jgi:hypothetical protein
MRRPPADASGVGNASRPLPGAGHSGISRRTGSRGVMVLVVWARASRRVGLAGIAADRHEAGVSTTRANATTWVNREAMNAEELMPRPVHKRSKEAQRSGNALRPRASLHG